MFKIIVHKRALKYLNKLTSFRKTKIKNLLTGLINNPIQREDAKPMLGEWKGYYRIRIGNVRLIFWVDLNKKIIYVDHIGPRGDVYK
ncbi:MAG: type II toxin-antitoxin system RelE/ParE family toxin [Candidatus Scalindua sp.]|nr:type II toxin-antitoxin system RelE/ParE family toxin [Candidatus Scalindua sp.]